MRPAFVAGEGHYSFLQTSVLLVILEVNAFGAAFTTGLRADDNPEVVSELNTFGASFGSVVHTEEHEH